MESLPDTIDDVDVGVSIERIGTRVVITAPTYRLDVRPGEGAFERAPYAALFGADGIFWSDLNLLASVHTATMPDETVGIGTVTVVQLASGDVDVRVECSSTAWERRETVIRCSPSEISISVSVAGTGSLTDVVMLGGDGSLRNGASGSFRSSIGFGSLMVPAATEPVQLVRPAGASAVLGVVGDADPGRLHAVFSPPPLVFGLSRGFAPHATDLPGGDWLGLSVYAAVRELSFTEVRWDAVDDGFRIVLAYEGHTGVAGTWQSPVLRIRPASSGWATIDDYRHDLVDAGFAPAVSSARHHWWLEPIFCGWGAQCARAVHLLHDGPDDALADTTPETPEEENLVARMAPTLARETVYDEFLTVLGEHDLHPGTIVIDDRWQAEYGSATVDAEHWPDLKRWIAARHADGQKVLLWWKAWDPAGIPTEECVTDAAGRPVSVDAGKPAYLRRLRRIVTGLLGPDGLDADGFKVDFTQRGPSGRTLRGTDGVWGIAALHALLAELYSAAKEAKPDALVVCHAVHPSFADVCDMVRLNDVSKFDPQHERVPVVDQVTVRYEIARRCLPDHPIDTDQWPMPNREEWLRYSEVQGALGVPALYYLESIDRSGERIHSSDLERVAVSWAGYRESLTG